MKPTRRRRNIWLSNFRSLEGKIHQCNESRDRKSSHTITFILFHFLNITECVTLGVQNCNVKLKEMEELHQGNVLFLPDQYLIYPLPWAGVEEYNVGEVLCEAYWMGESKHKVPVPSCSRTIAKNQLQRLLDEGYRLMSAFEMEFLLEDMAKGKKKLLN